MFPLSALLRLKISADCVPFFKMSDEEGSSVTPGLTDTSGSDEESEADWKDDTDSDEETQPPPPLSFGKDKAKPAEQLRTEGNDFFLKDRFNKAIAKYIEALKANPENKDNAVKCYRNMSICYSKKRNFRKAVDQALLAIQIQPNCARSYLRCGIAYKEMGKPMMAGVVFLKGLAIMPQSDEINKEWQTLCQNHKDEACHAIDYCAKNPNSDIRTLESAYNLRNIEMEMDDFIKSNRKQRKQMEATVPDLIVSSSEESDNDPADISNVTKPAKLRNINGKSTGVDSPKETDLAEQKKLDKEQEEHKKKVMKDKVLADQKRLSEKKREEEIKEAKRKKELEAKKKENEQKKREENERKFFRKREEKKLQEKKRSDPKQEIKARFKKICNEASTCLLNTVPSMEGFSKALEMVDREYNVLWSTSQYKDLSHNEEVVIIKYMFARACGETNNYEYIVAGLKKLDEIRENHKHVKFPTLFYGLSSLWVKLKRFDKATDAVKDGIEFLERGFNVTPYNWPGIPSKLVEETRKDILLEKLRTLACELKYPPRPDAVCRLNNCTQMQSHIVPSESIYISDPDYKGYFKVSCRMGCQVCYHKACWITVKGENIEKFKLAKVPTEKDFLGQSCFTPDCDAVIIKIEIFEDNFSKMTTIHDAKLCERLEDEERKRKKEERIKKEIYEHEKRVKMFQKKQIKKAHEKPSNKQKEKTEANNAVQKKSSKKKELYGEEFLKRNTNVNVRNWSKHEKKKGAGGNDEKDKSVRQELTCCYPDGCSQKNSLLNPDDLSDTQRVTCSNSKCDQSGYMHLDCFFKFETMVVGFLGKQPRCRMWTQQQCLINVWNKKGYEVAFKMCGCLCGHGKIRKDIDWTAPKAKAVVKEGATASVTGRKKTEEKVKLETVGESSLSQDYDLGEKNKQRNVNLEPPAKDFIAVNKENINDMSNESIKSDESLKPGKMENPTGIIKEGILNISSQQCFSSTPYVQRKDRIWIEVKQNSASIITLEESDELEETCSADNTIASTESSSVSEKSFESSHALACKPSLGEIAQQKEKIVVKLSEESPFDAAPKQMIAEQISCNLQTDINTKSSNLVNNNGTNVSCKGSENHITNNTVSACAQTDLALVKFGYVDPIALQQQNENLILELQEMKDKFYKIQSERKIVVKEYNDKYASMAEDNKNLRIENDSFKEKNEKMKKAISDATKISEELRKTTDSLKSTRSQLEETKKCLKEEQSQSYQINSQLTSLSQQRELESQLNDLLRAKLLQNDLRKYQEILRLKQENNQSVITLLRGSRELNNIPQVQLALISLNEYSARLLLADDQLNNQYATLVRQSEENKTVQELYFDLSRIEPPNLGPSCLNLLHNFVILSQSTSRSTVSPFSPPPVPISRSSTSSPLLPDLSTVTARGDARGPHVAKTVFSELPPGCATISTFPGSQVSGPISSPESASTSQDSFQTASASVSPSSLSPPSSPAPCSEVPKSRVIVANPKSASNLTATYPTSAGATSTYNASVGVTVSYPTSAAATPSYPTSTGGSTVKCSSNGANATKATTNGAAATFPTSTGATVTSTGATATYQTSTGASFASSRSAGATNPTGAKPRIDQNVDGASAKTGRKYDKLICLLQKNHPNLSPSQALDYVMKLRKSNNGKLTGMSIQDILDGVATFIDRDQDDDCSICFEDMASGDSVYLNPCRHQFHKKCINRWLESPGGAGSTCPMCRIYIVKEEEFPDLGAARRF